MPKTALILNISHNDIGQIHSLKRMGFRVVGTGNNPALPGLTEVDEYIPADYSDKDRILALAREKRIDAVCACCNDFGVLTAAYVAEKMGLGGHDPYEIALTLHHKDRFKRFAREQGILTPPSEGFDTPMAAKEWAEAADYPLMVKPVDLSGGKGCDRADDFAGASAAIDRAFAASKAKHVVLEPFIVGTQHACCTFLVGGKVRALCTNNEYSFVNPYLVEVDTFPASGFDAIRGFMLGQIEKIAAALNLRDGIFHAQYILRDGKPYVIEVMRRILGNLYMVPAAKLTGLDWDFWEARVHCALGSSGFPGAMEPRGFWAYRCVMGDRQGTVHGVRIPDDLRVKMFGKYELWRPGNNVEDEMHTQLGFYFFGFDSEKEMLDAMVGRYGEIHAEFE